MEIKNKESNFVSAVVYLADGYKEVVQEFLNTITDQFESNFKAFEIIVVNDACTDGSIEVIKSFAKHYSRAQISVLNMSYSQGKEKAIQAGVDLAIGDFVYEFESMLVDYDKTLIMDVYYEALKGYDIVSATQNIKPKLSSHIFYKLYNMFSSGQYAVGSEMFKVVSRRAINRVQSLSLVVPYRKAAYSTCGLKKTNLSYAPKYRNRINLRGKGGRGAKISTAIISLITYTNFAVKVAQLLLAITVAMLVGYGIMGALGLVIDYKLCIGMVVAIFVELLGTICIYYLNVVIRLIMDKKNYVFDSIEKITR